MAEKSRHRLSKLLKNSDLAMTVLNHARDFVMIADVNFHLIYISPSFQTVAGYTDTEWFNRQMDQILVPESVQRIRQVFVE